MAKLTISTVKIENLGPFRAPQIMDMRVRNDRPVILVKALNGSGKTTTLTALQVGLYGSRALQGLRRGEYERLITTLTRSDSTSAPSVEVGLTVEVGHSVRNIIVRREWWRVNSEFSEKLSVVENGTVDAVFSAEWDEFIDSVLPAELVQLFLFDGEKIEALANPERLPDLLKRATEVFLGIGGIDSLTNDLKAYERRTTLKRKKTQSAGYDKTLEQLEHWRQQLSKLEHELFALTQERGSAQNKSDQAKRALDNYSLEAEKKGLRAYQEAAKIRSDVETARERAQRARRQLIQIFSDPILPIALTPGLRTAYSRLWETAQQDKHNKLLLREFKKRDKRVLESLPTRVSKSAIEEFYKALNEDLRLLDTRRKSGPVRLQEAAPEEAEAHLRETRARLRTDLADLIMAEKLLDSAEQAMGAIPAEEQIGNILKQLQNLSNAAATHESALAAIVGRVEEIQSQLQHVQTRLNAAEDRLRTEFLDEAMAEKKLSASIRARKTLELFKEKLLASKAQWLSETITEEFSSLLRKRNFISKVTVDPTTYRATIEDKKGQQLPMERLSAGERQLLAISVLSSLIKGRKGRFPVVVDTPLARLDEKHRSLIIERFFATVSHQVLILSTDQEVEGKAYKTLSPYLSAEYSLNFDDIASETQIVSTSIEAA